jgi:hypothetical protein
VKICGLKSRRKICGQNTFKTASFLPNGKNDSNFVSVQKVEIMSHLTKAQRYEIFALKQAKFSQTATRAAARIPFAWFCVPTRYNRAVAGSEANQHFVPKDPFFI